MERRFFMNDFERSLKEHVDDFKMIPSKKVWHGIYNDMHPGRRWPSVAMSLLLIFTLVVVGHLNTHNGFHSTNANFKIAQKENIAGNEKIKSISKNNKNNIIKSIKKNIPDDSKGLIASATIPENSILPFTFSIEENVKNNTVSSGENLVSKNDVSISTLTSDKNPAQLLALDSKINSTNIPEITAANTSAELQKGIDLNNSNEDKNLKGETSLINNDKPISLSNEIKMVNTGVAKDKNLLQEKNTSHNTEPNFSNQQNKIVKFHKKRNENISWTYYAAPVAGAVSFGGKEIKESLSNSLSPAVVINSAKPNKVIHNIGYGFEAGVQTNFRLSSKLKFTTGLQLTYSGYKITSNEVHPTFATLILRDAKTGNDYSNSYVTHYGDGTGLAIVTLRNYSWQASIPVGLQYEVYRNNKIQFNVAANFEPSAVIKGNGSILSSDGRNYVNDPALLRKWNASSNFGTFVSFGSNKLKWQIGPNVRYQWFSTYQKSYTVKEHLIDYGIRLGITR